MASNRKKHPGGRPRKFNEASRPVTVTLPERTLQLLASVSPDRARAIAKLADAVPGGSESPQKPVELMDVAPGKSAILVAYSAHLARLPWLRLVEIAPARHLISLAPGTPVEKLELAIGDLLDTIPEREKVERGLLEELRRSIREPRRDRKIVKEEILFVESAD